MNRMVEPKPESEFSDDLKALADCIGWTIVGIHGEVDYYENKIQIVLEAGDPAHPDRILTFHGFGMYDDGGLHWKVDTVK